MAADQQRDGVPERFRFEVGYRLSLVLEPDGTVRTVTEVAGIDGLPPQAFVGRTIQALSAAREGGPERGRMWEDRLALAREATTAAHYIDPPPGEPDRSEATAESTLTPIRLADGTLDSILMVAEDRTAALETAEALDVSEQRFQMLAESLPQMVWSVTGDGVADYFAPRWHEFTGRDETEMLGEGYLDLIHPDDLATIARDQTREAHGRPTIFRLRRHDGEYRWMEAYVQQFHDEHGGLVRAVGGTTDITHRRAAEDKAREQEEQLRSALALTGLGRFTVDLRSRSIHADDRVAEIYGIDTEPLLNSAGPDTWEEGLFDFIHPDDLERVHETFNTAIAGSHDLTLEYRILRRAGDDVEERLVASVGRVEVDEDGPRRIIGVLEDITDRKREEETRLRVQKRDAVGTLAAGVAHDFNNVIGAILSNASLAQTEINAGVSPATSVTEIARAAVRAAELVRRMLAYSREDEPVRRDVDLGSVVREVCALLRPTVPPAAQLVYSIDPALPAIQADANQIHQIVMNLVTNARQALGEGAGRIEVLVDRGPEAADAPDRAGSVRLRVRDDGPGMSAAVKARVFDPFFSTKPSGEGTGLGLSSVQTITRQHGGEIGVCTQLGQGSTFTVTFPIPAHEVPDPAVNSQTNDTSSGPRVLFVDDQAALVTLAERAMPAYGCVATGFTEPLEALEAFVADPDAFDALVTDLSMPDLDGLELSRKLRAVRPALPIVLTSGYLSPAKRNEAEEQGIDAVVPKPSTMNDLASTVLRLMETAAAA